MTNRKLFTELKQRTDRIPDAELDAFWATLAPATMVYDGQPTLDQFNKIDADTVMGIMNGKHVVDDGRYFYLERVEEPAQAAEEPAKEPAEDRA